MEYNKKNDEKVQKIYKSSFNVKCTFLAILGSIAGAAADTWASEVGSVLLVSGSQKRKAKEEDIKREKLVMCRLIVWPMKRVPRGTNGGVSMGGLLASVVGALVVAVVSLATLLYTKGLSFETDEDRLLVKVFVLSLTVSGKFELSIKFKSNY